MTKLNFDNVQKGSPEEILINLQRGQTTYAVVYEILCRLVISWFRLILSIPDLLFVAWYLYIHKCINGSGVISFCVHFDCSAVFLASQRPLHRITLYDVPLSFPIVVNFNVYDVTNEVLVNLRATVCIF